MRVCRIAPPGRNGSLRPGAGVDSGVGRAGTEIGENGGSFMLHGTHKKKARWIAAATAAVLSTLSLLAIGMTSAHATTSVEGNCMATVQPTATDNLDGTATIAWTDGCTDLVNNGYYEVEVSADGGATWTLVATNILTARLVGPPTQNGSYIDTNPPCGDLVYRVIAVHAPGKALPKTSISLATTPSISPAGACGGGGGTGTCTQLTGALTLGYYSNKNGQATITNDDVTFLSGQVLVNYAGTDQTFANANDIKKWLLSATAKNMSYMLSAQLATLELNIRHGLVDPGAILCDVPGNPTIGDVVAAAIAYVAANHQVLGGDPNRADGDALETLIDEINNNLVSVQ
jgi:hypothetical protein